MLWRVTLRAAWLRLVATAQVTRELGCLVVIDGMLPFVDPDSRPLLQLQKDRRRP